MNETDILAWEHDPFAQAITGQAPVPATPIARPVPDLSAQALPITIAGTAPTAQRYQAGTREFRYWTAAEALRRGADFWASLVPAGTRWFSTVGQRLRVELDFGEDLNAFYTRRRLEFYHATVAGVTLFSGESADVVSHELGHAVLDAIRPQLFDAASIEAAAFHESFGDMSAILVGLQLTVAARARADGNPRTPLELLAHLAGRGAARLGDPPAACRCGRSGLSAQRGELLFLRRSRQTTSHRAGVYAHQRAAQFLPRFHRRLS